MTGLKELLGIPKSRRQLFSFIDRLEEARKSGSSEDFMLSYPFKTLLRHQSRTQSNTPKIFSPQDFPEVSRTFNEVVSLETTASPFPQWAAKEANRASYLWRSGMPAWDIYDELRLDRFLYQIQRCGNPYGKRGDGSNHASNGLTIFGAWRSHFTGCTITKSENPEIYRIARRNARDSILVLHRYCLLKWPAVTTL